MTHEIVLRQKPEGLEPAGSRAGARCEWLGPGVLCLLSFPTFALRSACVGVGWGGVGGDVGVGGASGFDWKGKHGEREGKESKKKSMTG